jgi:hypothetical protein
MWILDNNHANAVSENMMRISKSNIYILRMQLQILQITASARTPLKVGRNMASKEAYFHKIIQIQNQNIHNLKCEFKTHWCVYNLLIEKKEKNSC